MALTLALSGDSSCLSAQYFPAIDLNQEYVCGLIDLQTFNSIPNVDATNNLFHIGVHTIEIPIGSYEVDDIAEYIINELYILDPTISLSIKANNNTMKCEISSGVLIKNGEKTSASVGSFIYFDKSRSIGSLLGFSQRELPPLETHTSDNPIDVNKINVIRVECDIIAGSYMNGMPSHTLHEFSPETPPGYKIVEVPRTVIYLPVTVKRISSITVKLLDQKGDLINFRGETITIRLHLKPSL